ncbi:MAG: beta-galactosidase [Niabella sp.]|nr:beta-galactosidase [Niabella sp.]
MNLVKKMWVVFSFFLLTNTVAAQTYELDASHVAAEELHPIPFSGVNPQGIKLSANNRYFLKNNKPWFPLMGEMHYNRVPPQDWESGILKMKSAGLSIIATYIFWNEHETEPGVWDWKNNRDLRKFVELCGKHGMYVWLRIGPWAHGEQLHGGHPEWIAKMKGRRTNDPTYIAAAAKLFNQIGAQTKGLFFQDSGPVIGTQLENEYASGQAEHITKLKQIAQEAGIRPVFWSVTANTVFDENKMEVIPLQGSYCYRGWEKAGGGPTADFLYGDDQWIMGDALGKLFYTPALFPRGLCEQGAGSQMTGANRFVVEPYVEEAHLQNQIGRGMNLIGYYMFHGGTQTPGLKEPGLPESYDFQAPVGEFGIIRPSYKCLKILHNFINDFGTELAAMPQVEPAHPVRDVHNTKDLRYIARVKDKSGFLFLMNTQVRVLMPDRKVTVNLKLKNETIQFPSILLKGQTNLMLPFNLELNGVLIKYATAQPMAKIEEGRTTTLFLVKPEGVNAVIALERNTLKSKNGPEVLKLEPGVPLQLTSKTGKRLVVITLTREEAENSWRTTINGTQALVITHANLINNGSNLQLQQVGSNIFNFKVYPRGLPGFVENSGAASRKLAWYDDYSVSVRPYQPEIKLQLKNETALVQLPASLPEQVNDILLRIQYLGGSATARQDQKLLSDNLFNGIPWLFSAKNYLGKGTLQFDIQRWGDTITGVDKELVEKIKSKGAVVEKIEALPEYKVIVNF